MSKKTLKVTFEYGDVTYRLKWKGHPYCQTSVCDFLNAFVEMLGLGLEVRPRATKNQQPKTK
ncbi:hypothetical protein [Maribacter sp. 4U21]|uniref:hypothetical protein n=1 Tax=Maribacter sp. 4U21 TaxID=1889779 RepID=UPI001180266A|nr:hypothetical protein [Maribacter sp. 4U21]